MYLLPYLDKHRIGGEKNNHVLHMHIGQGVRQNGKSHPVHLFDRPESPPYFLRIGRRAIINLL